MELPRPLPRDRDELVREIDATNRMKEVSLVARLREESAWKWWEAGLVLMMFVLALGFLATVLLSLSKPEVTASGRLMLDRWTLIWLAPLMFSLLLSIEVALMKLRALRRLHDVTATMLTETRKELAALREEVRHNKG